MKKIFILFLLFSINAFAGGSAWDAAPEGALFESSSSESISSEDLFVSSSSKTKELPSNVERVRIAHPKEHRGFYSNFSTGFSYINFHAEQVDGIDYEEVSFQGFTFPLMDFRFGVAVGNLIAFYTEFNFTAYMGEADDTDINCWGDHDCDVEDGSDDNSVMTRTYVGFGMSLYPFRDTSSALNGFFIGGSIGYGAFFVYGDELATVDASANLDWGFSVEIGKDWWVNDHLSLGVSAAYFHASPMMNVTGDDNAIHGFHILFRLTRG